MCCHHGGYGGAGEAVGHPDGADGQCGGGGVRLPVGPAGQLHQPGLHPGHEVHPGCGLHLRPLRPRPRHGHAGQCLLVSVGCSFSEFKSQCCYTVVVPVGSRLLLEI